MRIVVFWEDQRGRAAKGFGPDELLVSCVADELLRARDEVKKYIVSLPKRGNGTVIAALRNDLGKMDGPVYAVLDRDKVLKLWPAGERPPVCLSGIREAMAVKAPGNYELILLSDNMETIIEACCQVTKGSMPRSKPSPDERDRILRRPAWGDKNARDQVRNAVPSFNRLVLRVADRLRPIINRSQ